MFAIFAFLGLLKAAVVASQQAAYPPTKFSTGFELVVNVTDASTDLSPSIHGWTLQGIHTGAGQSAAGLNNTVPTMIFYQNGTVAEVYYKNSTILTDASEPFTPYGILVNGKQSDDTAYLSIDVGSGTRGVTFSKPPYPMTELGVPGAQLIACDETLKHYGPDRHFVLLKALYSEIVDGQVVSTLPEGCTKVSILPQCATLPTLPAGSYSSHEYANSVRCFEDVANIDWTQYSEV